ncbi:MAG: lipopolysaccharide biosynthesis protein [Mariniphaga sp.]|nr:lipopolysaccharide biosynthesis protein [Mariniphaga sp.]
MTSIRKSLSSGIFYTALAKYSGVFISIFIGAILARLLTPKEFGIVALVSVFVSFFSLLSDFGIGQAVVQNQTLTEKDIHSIFSFSIILSLFLSGLFFFTAPFISAFYNEPELINVSKLLSLSVLFNSLQVIPKALFQKALKFKQIGIITVIIQVITGFIAIIMAFKGYSYYSLVFQSIISGLCTLIIFYSLSPLRIVLKIEFNAIKKIIRFSSFNFLFNFINYFTRNGDNLLIGKFLGSTSLGFYDKSYRLMMMPVLNLTHVITPVLMPVLSKYQDDKDVVYNSYLKVVKILATIGFPLSVFLFFSSYEIVNIIYGSQWDQSIPVFKLISITIGIQIIYSSAGSVFQAINRTDLLFYYGIIGAVILLSCISCGIFWGKSIEAVGIGLIVAFSMNFFIVFYMLISLALKKSYLHFLNSIIYPVFISLFIAMPLWFYSMHASVNLFLSLAIKIAITGLTFILLFFYKKENRKILQIGIKDYIKS